MPLNPTHWTFKDSDKLGWAHTADKNTVPLAWESDSRHPHASHLCLASASGWRRRRTGAWLWRGPCALTDSWWRPPACLNLQTQQGVQFMWRGAWTKREGGGGREAGGGRATEREGEREREKGGGRVASVLCLVRWGKCSDFVGLIKDLGN